MIATAAKRGGQTLYTPEIAEEICERLENGEPLQQICRDEHMPAVRTVDSWRETNSDFAAKVGHARTRGYDAIALQALEIADTQELGITRKTEGEGSDAKITETEEDMLGHRKLRIETRLKLLACWDPRRYGNKLEIESNQTHTFADLKGCTDRAGEILKDIDEL